MRTLQRLAELADDAGLDLRPELYAEFESGRPVSEKILETADKLRADLIIMGLHDSAHTGVISHLDLATTYDVVCQAGSPVLTVNCFSGYDASTATDRSNSFAFVGGRCDPQSRVRSEVVDESVSRRRPDE